MERIYMKKVHKEAR